MSNLFSEFGFGGDLWPFGGGGDTEWEGGGQRGQGRTLRCDVYETPVRTLRAVHCMRELAHVCSAGLVLLCRWESASAEFVSKGADSPPLPLSFQNEFKCLMDAPGLNKDNLGIEVDGDVLRVSVQRSLPRCMKGDDENSVNWHRMERGPVRGSRYVIVIRSVHCAHMRRLELMRVGCPI